MPPRRISSLTETRDGAESRYARYSRETRSLLQDADHEAHNGNWREAAVKLHAALQSIAAAAGTCNELSLLYLLTEE